MIKLFNFQLCSTTLQIGLTEFQEKQIARKIEKWLLKKSIVCEVKIE